MSNSRSVDATSVEWMLAGGGESAALMRRVDWSRTPLGPMAGWSQSLKTTVATLLHSRHPMFLWWGAELIQIYNDAYVPSFGVGKHPAAMGQRGRDCWPEIWDIIGPQIDNVMLRGMATWHEDALVPIFRNGAIEEVYWTYGYSPVFDDDGRIGGTLVVCTETTGRVIAIKREQAIGNERVALLENERQAREAAERANRAKDDFLSIASHELRTPLNAVLGWVRLLQAGQLPPAEMPRAFDIIERNGRAQVKLIEDILDGARIINGKLRLEVRPVDLVTVVRAALDTIRSSADEKGVSITLDLNTATAPTIGDPERLQQVVWNMVSNAIKFTPAGGAVQVSLRQIGGDARLEVRDNGQGIDAAFLPHVFERFRQADGSTTRRYGGLGLGLALVSHLVEAHGGSVEAASEGVDKGSVFTVTLPLRSQTTASAAEGAALAADVLSDSHASMMRGLHVLVVDDETDARDLVATALRAHGADVTTASDAASAMALVQSRTFTVLVSDVGMPGLDGYDLIKGIRREMGARDRVLPAIALTAYSRDEDRRRAEGAGFQAYLSKPVDLNELVNLIVRLSH